MKLQNNRKNHLKSKVLISQLFLSGKVITKPPFRLLYLNVENSEFVGVQTLISVPKRRFKLAVSRNLIKRRISEAFRIESLEIKELIEVKKLHVAIGFVYIGHKEMEFASIQKKMKVVLTELLEKLKALENEK